MRPVNSADKNMNPSEAEIYPKGWFTHGVNTVGKCVSVIHTSIKPRAASISTSRFDFSVTRFTPLLQAAHCDSAFRLVTMKFTARSRPI
jgi:hypothetical protein